MKYSKKEIFHLLSYIAGIAVFIFLFFFFITASWIGFGVKENCQAAVNNYGGECVDALMHLIEDENADFDDKNSAVWALGQLGDKKALPFLQKYYNGEVNHQRCNRGETLCQFELQKAVKLLDGGLNISAFVWR